MFSRSFLRPISVGVAISWLSALPLPSATPSPEGWVPLLDEGLTRWERFLGAPPPSVAVPGYVHADDPVKSEPLGRNRDPLNVFSVRMVDGEPVLHITGRIFGVLATTHDFGNYHLRLQFRWGTEKHPPRADAPRDSGILYHCIAPFAGRAGNFWTRSAEYQIQEGDCGDLFSLGVWADVPAINMAAPGSPRPLWRYEARAPWRAFPGGRCAHGTDYREHRHGEWNTVELLVVGDCSVHVFNDRVVNVLRNLRRPNGATAEAVVSGPIQLQSEGAEIEYRRIEVRPLPAFPSDYQALFSLPPTSPSSS